MRVNKRWLMLVILNALFSFLIILLRQLDLINDQITGILYVINVIPVGWKALKENKLFTPISPSLIFDIAFGLYLLHLVNNYKYMEFKTQIVIISCMFIWKIITISNPAYYDATIRYNLGKIGVGESSFKIILTVMVIASTAAMFFEWNMAGGIPQLRPDVETFRTMVSYSSITHMIAVTSKINAALIGMYLVNKGHISIRKDWLLLLECAWSELLMIGTSYRGEMIFAPVIIFIFFALKYRIPIKYYIISAVIALCVIGAVPFLRLYFSFGSSYVHNIKQISKFEAFYFLTPLYESFATNFNILRLDISIFPDIYPFGYGIYSILPNIPFLDLGKSLAQVQNLVLNNHFYAGLTATYLSQWYADFGYAGCYIITVILAFWNNFLYGKYKKKNSFSNSILYAYTFYSSLWMFYANTIDTVYICFFIVIYIAPKIRIAKYKNSILNRCGEK